MILEEKKGKICIMKEIMIPPLMTTVVTGTPDLTTHLDSLNVVVEPVFGYSKYIAMARSYGELRPGTGKINICLWNYSARLVAFPKQTTVGGITSADVHPTMLVQKPTELKGRQRETTTKKVKNKGQTDVFDKIDLTGSEEWSEADQEEAQELIAEYASIFAMGDMDLGRPSLV